MTADDGVQGQFFFDAQMMLNEQIAMLKQICHPRLQPLFTASLASSLRAGSSPWQFRQTRLQFPADFAQSLEYGFCQLGDCVKLADLMPDGTEYFGHRGGIKVGGVRGNASEFQGAQVEFAFEAPEEAQNVLVRGIVIQHFIYQTPEGPVVDNGKHTEWPVIQFVRSDISRKFPQGVAKIVADDISFSFFFPRLPPSFERWQKGQTPGGRAISARRQRGMVSCPPQPTERPEPPPGEYNDTWTTPGRPSEH